ncbi:MAG: O-antigen ligase family protein [Nitrospinota bacterium]
MGQTSPWSPLALTVAMALAVGFWSPRLFALPFGPAFLMTFPLGLCLGFVLWWPEAALPLALFAMPLVNIHFELGLAEKTISFDKLLLVVIIAGWVLRKVYLRQWRLPRDPILSLWVIWLAVQGVTLAVTQTDVGNQLWYMTEQLSYVLFFVICLEVLKDRKTLRAAIQVVVASGWAVALLGMAQRVSHVLLGMNIFHLTYPDAGKWATEFGSTIGHPNFYSAFQVLSIPFTAWAVWHARGGWRGFFAAMLLVQCGSVFVAKSIGGVVGLAVAALVGCWWSGKPAWKVFGPVVAAVGVVAILWLVQARDPQGLDRSALVRTHILRVSRHVFFERPFFGHGLASFTRVFPDYEQVYGRERLVGELGKWRDFPRSISSHSWFLRLIIEGGLASLLTFLGLIGWVMATRWYSLRSPPAEREGRGDSYPLPERTLRVALAAALVGFVVQAFTDELFAYSKIVLIFWALTAVGVILDMRSRAADRA